MVRIIFFGSDHVRIISGTYRIGSNHKILGSNDFIDLQEVVESPVRNSSQKLPRILV